MSQQLQLFTDMSAESRYNSTASTTDDLTELTRQLFQHQGSNSELIQRILNATRAINESCK